MPVLNTNWSFLKKLRPFRLFLTIEAPRYRTWHIIATWVHIIATWVRGASIQFLSKIRPITDIAEDNKTLKRVSLEDVYDNLPRTIPQYEISRDSLRASVSSDIPRVLRGKDKRKWNNGAIRGIHNKTVQNNVTSDLIFRLKLDTCLHQRQDGSLCEGKTAE